MMSSFKGKTCRIPPCWVRHCVKTVGSGSMVHGKSSDLEQLNAEETVFLAIMVQLLLSIVLPGCVSQYFRQHDAFEVADDTSQRLAESCL